MKKKGLTLSLIVLLLTGLCATFVYATTSATNTAKAQAAAVIPQRDRYIYMNFIWDNYNNRMAANNRLYDWNTMWQYYNQIGDQGWELIEVTSVVGSSVYADEIHYTFRYKK